MLTRAVTVFPLLLFSFWCFLLGRSCACCLGPSTSSLIAQSRHHRGRGCVKNGSSPVTLAQPTRHPRVDQVHALDGSGSSHIGFPLAFSFWKPPNTLALGHRDPEAFNTPFRTP
ncbi:hypothetical protein F5144DRAFT_555374 [Chaetomium tenue]|uniref:Uncharacterized protein n=1 Tax=Chaetomium tenue TaxID=1854479 RepID=A0ACB7PQA2_9PEZI|nr:hypothetical protein F5144DRAFT_555374 [Chaetomium globosum]